MVPYFKHECHHLVIPTKNWKKKKKAMVFLLNSGLPDGAVVEDRLALDLEYTSRSKNTLFFFYFINLNRYHIYMQGKKPAALYKVKDDSEARSFIECCLAPVDERLSVSVIFSSIKIHMVLFQQLEFQPPWLRWTM
jgi:hypothetical protein